MFAKCSFCNPINERFTKHDEWMLLSMPSTPHKSTRASRNPDRKRKSVISLPAINQLLPTIHLTRDDD